jgi:hypothetical protein
MAKTPEFGFWHLSPKLRTAQNADNKAIKKFKIHVGFILNRMNKVACHLFRLWLSKYINNFQYFNTF